MAEDLNLNPTTDALAPDLVTILHFAGVAPEVWFAMTDARRAEWLRAYEFQHQRAAEQGVADVDA